MRRSKRSPRGRSGKRATSGFRFGGASKGVALIAVVALAAGLVVAGVAQGSLAKSGNVIVSFQGGIFPIRLPRTRLAPVSIRIGGKVKTTDRSEPPTLQKITLQINRHGKLYTDHLARCTLFKLKGQTSDGAKRVCKNSLVGHGNATTRVTFPGQGTFAVNGKLYAFYARVNGHPGILAHVYGEHPLSLTYVIEFEIRKHKKGTYGTTLVAKMPSIASGHGRISAFNITLSRRFHSHGKKRSFMSASCPAPKGFPGASFNFARATYKFDDGRTLSSTLSKQCKVRGR